MKLAVVLASLQFAMHINGATLHVTGPDERQLEFGDGTTSFATLSGGEGFINSTVTVNAPDFVTMTGTSVNEMMTLIRDQQATIRDLKEFVGMMPPSSPPPTPPPPVTCYINVDNTLLKVYVDGKAVTFDKRVGSAHAIEFAGSASILAFEAVDCETGCKGGHFLVGCESASGPWAGFSTASRQAWTVWTTNSNRYCGTSPQTTPPTVDGRAWTALQYMPGSGWLTGGNLGRIAIYPHVKERLFKSMQAAFDEQYKNQQLQERVNVSNWGDGYCGNVGDASYKDNYWFVRMTPP